MKLKQYLVKQQPLFIQAGQGDIWSFLGSLDNVYGLVCFQTGLQNGLAFFLIHHGHRVALSDTGVL